MWELSGLNVQILDNLEPAYGVPVCCTPYENNCLIIDMDYRRAWHQGGTYFFTVNCLQRKDNDLLVRHINLLREVIANVKKSYPFTIHAWVVLPARVGRTRLRYAA